MKLLTRLKNFVENKIDLSGLKEINLFSGININSHNDNRRLELNLNDVKDDQERRAELLAIVRQALADESALVIDRSKAEVIEDFSRFEALPETQQALEFFKGKLSAHDLGILRAALYIKGLHEQGQNVAALRQDLINRYGDRGKNISNLCTAGYFDSVIRPLYEEMRKDDNFDPQQFLKRVDVLIDDFPYAVFVHTHMSVEQLKAAILAKLETAKRYGLGKINIHGIGRENVRRIEGALRDEEIRSKITDLPTIDKTATVIAISITL